MTQAPRPPRRQAGRRTILGLGDPCTNYPKVERAVWLVRLPRRFTAHSDTVDGGVHVTRRRAIRGPQHTACTRHPPVTKNEITNLGYVLPNHSH